MANDDVAGLLFFGFAAFVVYAGCQGWPALGDSISSRQFWCVKKEGKWAPFVPGNGKRTQVYRVSFDNQRVMADSLHDLGKCKVFDKKNWECRDKDGSLWRMEKGELQSGCAKTTIFQGMCYTELGWIANTSRMIEGDAVRCEKDAKTLESLLETNSLIEKYGVP